MASNPTENLNSKQKKLYRKLTEDKEKKRSLSRADTIDVLERKAKLLRERGMNSSAEGMERRIRLLKNNM